MIETFVTHERIVEREPLLQDYLRSNQVNFDGLILEAKKDMIQDIINQGYHVRRLCKRLSLDAQTVTEATDGTKSSEDYAQRNRVVISVSALTDEAVFTLQGTEDDSSETWTTIDTFVFTEIGSQNIQIVEMYKYYRLNVTSATSVTYSAYMIESSFDNLHVNKSLELIFNSLNSLTDDAYISKSETYKEKYMTLLTGSRFYVDEDDDSSIDESESDSNNMEVTFTR